jgi:hypothetical protein
MPKYLGFNLMFIVRFAFLEALFSLCSYFRCVNESFAHGLPFAGRGQVELQGGDA